MRRGDENKPPKKGTKSDMCKVTADLSDADAEWSPGISRPRNSCAPGSRSTRPRPRRVPYKLRCEKCHEINGSCPTRTTAFSPAGADLPVTSSPVFAPQAAARRQDEAAAGRSADEEEALLHFELAARSGRRDTQERDARARKAPARCPLAPTAPGRHLRPTRVETNQLRIAMLAGFRFRICPCCTA